MATKKIEKFYARDRADDTWSACMDEKQAERMVLRAIGDWTDPVVGYGVLVQFDGPPERVYTESEVRAMLNELLDRSERDAGNSTVVRAVEISHLAHRQGIVLGQPRSFPNPTPPEPSIPVTVSEDR